MYRENSSVGTSQLMGQRFYPKLYFLSLYVLTPGFCVFAVFQKHTSTPACPVFDCCVYKSVSLVCALLLGLPLDPYKGY